MQNPFFVRLSKNAILTVDELCKMCYYNNWYFYNNLMEVRLKMNMNVREFVEFLRHSGKVYTAISCGVPLVGRSCDLQRLEIRGNVMNFVAYTTSTVQKVEQVSWDTYLVLTENSIYWVKVAYLPAQY